MGGLFISARPSLDGAGWCFGADGEHDLRAALNRFLGSLEAEPRLLGQRDAMMAANLQAIVAHEVQRGPTLVFAYNRHLQKDLRTWQLEGMALSWWSAGAIAAAQMGDQYAFLASALGSAADQGLDAPKADTLEGALSTITGNRCIFNSRRLAQTLRSMGAKLTLRTDTSTRCGYFALDPDCLEGTDGVIFIKDIPSGSHRIRTGDPGAVLTRRSVDVQVVGDGSARYDEPPRRSRFAQPGSGRLALRGSRESVGTREA